MSDIAIRVEGLGKRYRLGQQVGYKTLRETFFLAYHTPTRILGQRLHRMRWTEDRGPKTEVAGLPSPVPSQSSVPGPRSPVTGPQSPVPSQSDHIWALKDVSFEVKRGEAVGIIGRNGSGKSTLLKILSRITAPTEGQAEIHGRVGSLLEVGTGFHPELTGRENIYLNGAIIGMKKAEIERRFDEIVAFAEIEKFLDTPVKRYSSGMYVRLAFAVAAHLEPDILIVDEVLAVGDAAFQKKCLGKMGNAATEGHTVLFVSHSMPTIENLCSRVLWIDAGRIVDVGESRKVVANYVDTVNKTMGPRRIGEYQNLGHRRGSGEIQFTEFRLMNSDGIPNRTFAMGESIHMEVDFQVHKDVEGAVFGLGLVDALTQVFVTNWRGSKQPQSLRAGEQGTFCVALPQNPLRARSYYFYLGVTGHGDIPYDIWDGVGTEFTVTYPADVDSLAYSIGRDVALVTLPIQASIRKG
jgi:lipopolysaccharide transport system ATP-binding protein